MVKRFLIIAFAIVFVLTGCAKKIVELPAPPEIYAAITETIALPELVELPEELFIYSYGIEPEWFDSAVSYSCLDSMKPDEIVIIRAVDEEAANNVRKKLKTRLAYKIKSAENYLPETVPILNNGVVRQDGLIVSMIVSGEITAIINVYKNMS